MSLLSKTDIPPEEKEEIELLEQVLKKALKIRSTSGTHEELHSDSSHEKHPKLKAFSNYTVKEESKRKPVKSSPPLEMCKKPNHPHRRAAGGSVTQRSVLIRKGPFGVKGRPPVPQSAPVKISSTGSQQKMCVKATNAKESSPSVSCREVSGKDGKFTTGNVQSNTKWYVSYI